MIVIRVHFLIDQLVDEGHIFVSSDIRSPSIFHHNNDNVIKERQRSSRILVGLHSNRYSRDSLLHQAETSYHRKGRSAAKAARTVP